MQYRKDLPNIKSRMSVERHRFKEKVKLADDSPLSRFIKSEISYGP